MTQKQVALSLIAPAAEQETNLPARAGAVRPELPARQRAEGAAAVSVSTMRDRAHRRCYLLSLRLISFLVIVVLPVAVAGIYYLCIAADQYVVEFRFGVRGIEPAPIGLPGLFSASLTPSPTVSDSYVVVQYIESRAMVDDLGRTLDLPAIFSRPQADWFARLDPPVPVEELVRYWRGQVDAFYDATDRTITVKVRAFTPRDALVLGRAVLGAAERLVNSLSARARRDALAAAQRDLASAATRLTAVLVRLRQFRDHESVIDPRQSAQASAALAAKIRDELVHARAELAQLEHYMSGDAPALELLRARIQALEAEERAIAGEITNTDQSRAHTLARLMTTYEAIDSQRRFAETAYQHALQALDRARRDADRQQVYLVPFVKPSLPEEPLYPQRLIAIGVVFLVAFAIWAIGSLIVQSIRDHL
jgi:capsular polysaccharide transport system permease protein